MSIAKQVSEILNDCLYTDAELGAEQEVPADSLIGDGIIRKFAFHPSRLEARREDVRSLLNQMSDEFHVGKGGGMSLLRMCIANDGSHWGEQLDCGNLVALGTALRMASLPFPREMWDILPGNLPYVLIDARAKVPA